MAVITPFSETHVCNQEQTSRGAGTLSHHTPLLHRPVTEEMSLCPFGKTYMIHTTEKFELVFVHKNQYDF
ncbi:hypothetical protein E2C01_062243 [Portunus trituberculatus]|uniref:Uncharacterized protein n=1 Tax=Portunus trituberculatus TaxID=210409 RepID=A0A5B7HD39_PORTR|nr:hypothetical protein [Portunus trituberculatus]